MEPLSESLRVRITPEQKAELRTTARNLKARPAETTRMALAVGLSVLNSRSTTDDQPAPVAAT